MRELVMKNVKNHVIFLGVCVQIFVLSFNFNLIVFFSMIKWVLFPWRFISVGVSFRGGLFPIKIKRVFLRGVYFLDPVRYVSPFSRSLVAETFITETLKLHPRFLSDTFSVQVSSFAINIIIYKMTRWGGVGFAINGIIRRNRAKWGGALDGWTYGVLFDFVD